MGWWGKPSARPMLRQTSLARTNCRRASQCSSGGKEQRFELGREGESLRVFLCNRTGARPFQAAAIVDRRGLSELFASHSNFALAAAWKGRAPASLHPI